MRSLRHSVRSMLLRALLLVADVASVAMAFTPPPRDLLLGTYCLIESVTEYSSMVNPSWDFLTPAKAHILSAVGDLT